jgi:nitrate/nitrite transporter NarK
MFVLTSRKGMKGSNLLAGLAGSTLLTGTHEITKRSNANAPRMDLLGMEALRKILKAARLGIPGQRKLFLYTMAGDLLVNGLYYASGKFISKKNAVAATIIIGVLGGIGAVVLPRALGLSNAASSRTSQTKLLTIGLYTLGGIVSAIAGTIQSSKKS